MSDDEQHLRLLAIFHYIVGGLTAFFSCFALIHFFVGVAIVSGGLQGQKPGQAPPEFIGWLFIGFASLFILLGWTYAISMIFAGRRLSQRRSYVYCLVMAALTCPQMPIGTCLGVFTIIVLARPSVKRLFEARKLRVVEFGLD